MKINERDVNVCCPEAEGKLPAVVLIGAHDDPEEILQLTDRDRYILITIDNINWNDDLSPWYMDPLYRNDRPYNGRADDFIREMENDIMPVINDLYGHRISCYAIAGYSLAGLFALYSLYKTDLFTRAASVSGSLWYPDFRKYAVSHNLKGKTEKIYLSLGDREKLTRNAMMATVEDNTRYLEGFYSTLGIKTVYISNPGNHFQDASKRLADGINWIIREGV